MIATTRVCHGACDCSLGAVGATGTRHDFGANDVGGLTATGTRQAEQPFGDDEAGAVAWRAGRAATTDQIDGGAPDRAHAHRLAMCAHLRLGLCRAAPGDGHADVGVGSQLECGGDPGSRGIQRRAATWNIATEAAETIGIKTFRHVQVQARRGLQQGAIMRRLPCMVAITASLLSKVQWSLSHIKSNPRASAVPGCRRHRDHRGGRGAPSLSPLQSPALSRASPPLRKRSPQ